MTTAHTIEVLKSKIPPLKWYPKVAKNANAFFERKLAEGEVSKQELEATMLESQVILGRCIDPNGDTPATNTGLVVGYVQSGKTLSFTAITALARDNGFGLVIVLAGTQLNLKEQSEDRLAQDLDLRDEGVARAWKHLSNPSTKARDTVRRSLQLWANVAAPEHMRRALLITVLKHPTHLENLAKLLEDLDLSAVPTLVIDDEADQASLNTKARKGGKSPTYSTLLRLRAALPRHTFLQYTATPQANLLISISDLLSPDFSELVTPGEGYVGGKELFVDSDDYVVPISDADQTLSLNGGARPPSSLLSALKLFLLGIAYEVYKGSPARRSMMIHPSQPTRPHGHFAKWVRRALAGWSKLVGNANGQRILKGDFKEEHASLSRTVPDLPSLDLLIPVLQYLLDGISVEEINRSGREDKDFEWSKSDYWILIGGQKLDRGFTVKGLTVTYMPRPLKGGNADTIQQRARFFGYKKSYKGLCRVFLPQDVKAALKDYVAHEEDIRAELERYRGRPLKEWYRKFLLPSGLNPTRANVLTIKYKRLRLRQKRWIKPDRLHLGESFREQNLALLTDLRKRWATEYGATNANVHPQFRDTRSSSAPNVLVEPVPLLRVYEDFLLEFRIEDTDEADQKLALLKLIALRLQKNPNETASVFFVGDLEPAVRTMGKSFELFQGYVPMGAPPEKRTYVGDAQLFDDSRFTLHLRVITPKPRGADTAWYAARIPSGWRDLDVLFRDKEVGQ